MFFLDLLRHLKDKHGRKVSFLIMVSFLFAFVAARIYALVAAPILEIGGIHIHHLNFGIGLLAISGLLGFYFSNSNWRKKIIVFYGIGLGLTFDEFGMWLHLEDHYWIRTSYDAIIIISLILLNAIFFGERWIRILKYLIFHAGEIKNRRK
ncbi:MAG: hypothetical protein V1732_04070, partial [Patescibacteria group bacterium]|nr:hypothetical protein [Patescibacteria group bacterium]MBU4141960.1 hypothetical protein [Patescibacteria group bacterium]